MTGRVSKGFLLACAAGSIACGSDGLGPITNKTPTSPSDPRVLTVVELSPAIDTVFEGYTSQLYITLRSQSGDRMFDKLSALTYTSSDPAIATVSSTGLVAGVAPGTVTISASATIGTSTKSGMMTASVQPLDAAANEVVLSSGSRGWQPTPVHLKAGGTVHWVAGSISWGGVPNSTVWLMDNNYSDLDSLDLRSGSVTRKFDKPGVFQYCSGGCWDPPDFGTIYVH